MGCIQTQLQSVLLFVVYSFTQFPLLLKEIARVQEENDKLKARLRTIESQVYNKIFSLNKHTADSL